MVRWQWQRDLRKKDEDEEGLVAPLHDTTSSGVFEDYSPADTTKLETAYKAGLVLQPLEFIVLRTNINGLWQIVHCRFRAHGSPELELGHP